MPQEISPRFSKSSLNTTTIMDRFDIEEDVIEKELAVFGTRFSIRNDRPISKEINISTHNDSHSRRRSNELPNSFSDVGLNHVKDDSLNNSGSGKSRLDEFKQSFHSERKERVRSSRSGSMNSADLKLPPIEINSKLSEIPFPSPTGHGLWAEDPFGANYYTSSRSQDINTMTRSFSASSTRPHSVVSTNSTSSVATIDRIKGEGHLRQFFSQVRGGGPSRPDEPNIAQKYKMLRGNNTHIIIHSGVYFDFQ